MKTKTMSALLRAVLLAAGLLLAVFFFLFLPFYHTNRCCAMTETLKTNTNRVPNPLPAL